MFAVGNLCRIPPFNPSDPDVCSLAMSLCSLRAEVESLASLKNELADLRCLRTELSAIIELKKSALVFHDYYVIICRLRSVHF